MREIKFRAWDREEKYMGFVLGMYLEKNGWVDIETGKEESDTEDRTRLKNVDLMQYTGLKDYKNREIFEGDVLTIGTRKIVVEWTTKKRIGFNISGQYKRELPIEIIGNIYENPELIKS